MGNMSEIFGEAYDPSQYEPKQDGFEPITPGWYPAEIEKAEVKTTNAGDGKYLKLQFLILGDKYANRKAFTNINLSNPNEKAVEIGMRELASLAIACNLKGVQDSEEFVGKAVMIHIKVTKAQGTPGTEGYRAPDNDIDNYRMIDGNNYEQPPVADSVPSSGQSKPISVKPPVQQSSGGSQGKMPWQR